MKTEEEKACRNQRQAFASANNSPFNLNFHETRFATSWPPDWRHAGQNKVVLSLGDSHARRLRPAGSSRRRFNCLPCHISSAPPLIPREETKRALEEILEFNFAASRRFIIQGRRETVYLSDQENTREDTVQPPGVFLFLLSRFEFLRSQKSNKITAGFCSKSVTVQGKKLLFLTRRI